MKNARTWRPGVIQALKIEAIGLVCCDHAHDEADDGSGGH